MTTRATDLTEADFAAEDWEEIGETENLGSVGDTSEEIFFNGINSSRTRRLMAALICATICSRAWLRSAIAAARSALMASISAFDPSGPNISSRMRTKIRSSGTLWCGRSSFRQPCCSALITIRRQATAKGYVRRKARLIFGFARSMYSTRRLIIARETNAPSGMAFWSSQ